MGNFKIKVLNKKAKKFDGICYRTGTIKMNDYYERFMMAIADWEVKDYQEQWHEGLNRIKHYETSCLVASVYSLPKDGRAHVWALYRVDNQVIIHDQLLIDQILEAGSIDKKIKDFTKSSCYDYLPPLKRISDYGQPITEWIVSIDDF
ncbi:MAG: hypothetical protein K2X39_00140 [Silvanigrellaceae bacterium]|nr:hypothetical protein [Silvanigrellaceae bacterium]